MSCDVGKAREGLENKLWRRWSGLKLGEWAELILQAFCRFTYVTAHSPSFLSLHLRHSSFCNHSLALPTSQLILQPFRCFTYVTAHSPTLLSLLRHRIFTYVIWSSRPCQIANVRGCITAISRSPLPAASASTAHRQIAATPVYTYSDRSVLINLLV